MNKIKMSAAALGVALLAIPASAQVNANNLVNVNLSDIVIQDIANDLNVNISDIPRDGAGADRDRRQRLQCQRERACDRARRDRRALRGREQLAGPGPGRGSPDGLIAGRLRTSAGESRHPTPALFRRSTRAAARAQLPVVRRQKAPGAAGSNPTWRFPRRPMSPSA